MLTMVRIKPAMDAITATNNAFEVSIFIFKVFLSKYFTAALYCILLYDFICLFN